MATEITGAPSIGIGRPESVVYGRDHEVIPLLLNIHAPNGDPLILDVTYNRGVMWKHTPYKPVTMDIDPQYKADTHGDCRAIPWNDQAFDVVAFDPPHLPAHAASPNSSGIERMQYGLTEHGDYRQGDTIHDLFPPFLEEAKRVLVPGGIVIAKLADYVHNHRYQWSHVEFINAVEAIDGLVACDVIVKADPCASNLKSSKWQNVKHFRRAHAYWIVVRKGHCEKKAA